MCVTTIFLHKVRERHILSFVALWFCIFPVLAFVSPETLYQKPAAVDIVVSQSIGDANKFFDFTRDYTEKFAPADSVGQSVAIPNGSDEPDAAVQGGLYSNEVSSVKIFGTVEFKRPLASLSQWRSVVERNKECPIFVTGRYFNKNMTWDKFKNKAKQLHEMELLRFVNSFWNSWPYVDAAVNWGAENYWAIPAEFLERAGSCVDYVIIKYFTLKELGIPPENMRIVIVQDLVRNLGHAVLVVYMHNDAYVLDNLNDFVLSNTHFTQYSPQYSVNEFGRWGHLKGRSVN